MYNIMRRSGNDFSTMKLEKPLEIKNKKSTIKKHFFTNDQKSKFAKVIDEFDEELLNYFLAGIGSPYNVTL